MNAKLNKRERRAQQLLAHYETCERLARYLGHDPARIDGKRISCALLKLERKASRAATAQCNGETFEGEPFRSDDEWQTFKREMAIAVRNVVAISDRVCVPGFFVNGDPRGYALKIDNENPEGKALIDAVKLHTDWGGYGILSPEITGD